MPLQDRNLASHLEREFMNGQTHTILAVQLNNFEADNMVGQEANNNAGLEEAPMVPPIAAGRSYKYAWVFLGIFGKCDIL